MRQFLIVLALAAVSVTGAAAGATPQFESVTLSVLAPVDQSHLAKLETDLREIKGFAGVTWDLPSKKCTVRIDRDALCEEDLIRAINQKSIDGKPVVAPYVLPDIKTSFKEIKTILATMEETFQKSKQPKEIIPFLDRMGPHVEALGEAVRQADPPVKNGKNSPTYEKAREIALRIYILQGVAKREYTNTTEKALGDLRLAVDDMARALEPQPVPPPAGNPSKVS
jgi:hypothetical protein